MQARSSWAEISYNETMQPRWNHKCQEFSGWSERAHARTQRHRFYTLDMEALRRKPQEPLQAAYPSPAVCFKQSDIWFMCKLQNTNFWMACMSVRHPTNNFGLTKLYNSVKWETNRMTICLCLMAEISKAIDMYMFLFDDILLLTKVKKAPRKVTCYWRDLDIRI